MPAPELLYGLIDKQAVAVLAAISALEKATRRQIQLLLGATFGKKPHPDTLNLRLRNLLRAGLISVTRKKRYLLTRKGSDVLTKLHELGDIIEGEDNTIFALVQGIYDTYDLIRKGEFVSITPRGRRKR